MFEDKLRDNGGKVVDITFVFFPKKLTNKNAWVWMETVKRIRYIDPYHMVSFNAGLYSGAWLVTEYIYIEPKQRTRLYE